MTIRGGRRPSVVPITAPSFPTPPRPSVYRKIAYTFIAFTVIIVVGVLWLTSVKANVVIKVKRGVVPLAGTVEISKSPASGQMPGRVVWDTFTKIQNYKVADLAGETVSTTPPPVALETNMAAPTSPPAVVPTVADEDLLAKGTVRLINNYSKAQPLVRTTQLVTDDGKIYRLDKAVNIPSGGSATVAVYADKPGAAFAIPPTKFKILKLWKDLQPLIYAVSDEAFTAVPAGSPAPAPTKPVTPTPSAPKPVAPAKPGSVVTDAIITLAEQRLTDSVLEQAKKMLLSRITDAKLDDVTFYVREVEKPKTNVVAGQTMDEFMASVKLEVAAVFFAKDDMTALVRSKLKEKVPEGREFLPVGSDAVQIRVDSYNQTAESAVLMIQVNGEYRLTSSSPLLQKNVIAGKTKDEALTILKAVEGVEDAQITITPSWFSKIPALKDHIEIKVE